jgi:hypothetical protein
LVALASFVACAQAAQPTTPSSPAAPAADATPAPDAGSAEALSPRDTYLRYDRALEAAASLDEILPFFTADAAARLGAIPRAQGPEVLKALKNVRLRVKQPVHEDTRGPRAVVIFEGAPGEKLRYRDVHFEREGGTWKIAREGMSDTRVPEAMEP